jgi:Zn-dependent protease/predicted transcriptional regulator
MKYSLYLGRISGIRISVHWTFLLLIIWIVYSNIRSGLNFTEIVWSVGFVLVIFLCVILHELGHALAAQRYHIKTRDITILPIGGVAQLESMPEKPREELVVALAGPLVNVIIAGILFPFVSVSGRLAEFESLETIGSGNFLPALMSINLWLAVFNLIPAFPMDGGRVLRALLGFRLPHPKATRIAASIGQVLAIGFVFLGFIFPQPFLVFIGFFIFIGAQQEAVYSRSKFMLQGYTVGDVLMDEIPFIDKNASVREAATRLLHSQNKNFVVTSEGRPVGTLTRNEIIRALGERGENITVDEIKDVNMLVLSRTMPLEQAWNLMRQQRKPLMLVMSGGQLEGVVDEENVAEFVLVRTAADRSGARRPSG